MPHPISFGDKVRVRSGKMAFVVVDILSRGWLVIAWGENGYVAEVVIHTDNLILLEKARV